MTRINEIGNDMVACDNHCLRIALDLRKGILPRCLILETKDREHGKGSIIVGMNPGRSKEPERKFYRDNGQTYEQVIAYWQDHIGYRRKYYKRLRALVTDLGLKGPILWTELAKCESKDTMTVQELLPAFRTCTQSYLQKELQAVPSHWPLIAVGNESYKALAYIFTRRAVIGVPHPTGSYGHFESLFDTKDRLLPKVKMPTKDIVNGKSGKAVWLTVKQKRG
ncbi:MAG: hypothetical protein HZB30_01405 [Nitrospirae bacterium]|nr:hypothetical protein [Nitrospirota bacterium]